MPIFQIENNKILPHIVYFSLGKGLFSIGALYTLHERMIFVFSIFFICLKDLCIFLVSGEANECQQGQYVFANEDDPIDYEVLDATPPQSPTNDPNPDPNTTVEDTPDETVEPMDQSPSTSSQSNANSEDEIDTSQICTDEETVPEMSEHEIELKTAVQRTQKFNGQTVHQEINVDEIELTDHHYDPSWETIIDENLPKLEKATFCKAREWIELIVDQTARYNSKYGCRHCRRFLDEFKITTRIPNELSLPAGQMKKTLTMNNHAIRRHETLVSHKAVMLELKRRKTDKMNNITYVEEPHLSVTNKNFRNVYFGILTTMSFNNHAVLSTLEEKNGVWLGNYCRSKDSARKIAKSISLSMHDELLDFIKREKPYMSLIMDGSTGELFSFFI